MAKGILTNKNTLTKEILLTLAQVGVFTVALTSPYFLHSIVKRYLKEKSMEKERKKSRMLRELKKRKVIEFKESKDGIIKITLSHEGQKRILKYKLEDMVVDKSAEWDRLWRIVIYDIPKSKKKASDAFRIKLRTLGFHQLQKSVWVLPYECIDEIEFLCQVFEINMDQHVYYFKTRDIPQEKEIKKRFNLT